MADIKQTFPGGIRALVTQHRKRRSQLKFTEGEELPPLDVDFAALAQIKIGPQVPLSEKPSRVESKLFTLRAELAGQSELALLHGLLISHLRKHTYPDAAPQLFLRMWHEQEDWLLDNLEPRWLISAVITFAEHGETERDRRLAQSLNILFSLMKIYEAERGFSGKTPQEPFDVADRVAISLPMGMPGFSLIHGDLEASLLAPLWQSCRRAPAVGPLARQLLEMLNEDDGTLFRRLALMRGSIADNR